MTPERWAAAQALFEAALAVPDASRAAYVDAQAADADLAGLVHGLLAADAEERAGEPLDTVVRQAMADAAGERHQVPEHLGPYKIVRMLGEGGMGAVYLAERDDDEFLQQVAIKVVRGLVDPERVRQFRTERQILAWLEHPNIARLLDGGTTPDGLPYLVMEHVEGAPIDRYCDESRLDITARLRLFLEVCDAVSHAHRSLIVHRDIKPTNILVTTDGMPKLLDFGIARLAMKGAGDAPADGAATGAHRMMTPYYASPEVVRGDQVTTGADVYALGVLLHELLTGTRPLRFRTLSSAEVERVVCHVSPQPPSEAAREPGTDELTPEKRAAARRATPAALRARLTGDLDAIVAMALHKDPTARFASVEALAADLRAHLDGRPVGARPASVRYLVGRFVRRHRWGTAAAAIASVAVSVAAVVFSVQAARLAEERDKTARERDTAQQVSRFLVDLFEVANPEATNGGASVTAREVLDRGAERIDAELAGQPFVQARLLATMGTAFGSLGEYKRALSLFERALELRRSTLGRDHLDTVAAMDEVGEAHRKLAQYDVAERMHRDALTAKRRLGAPLASVADSLNNVGLTLSQRGRHAEAEPMLREAIDLWRRHSGPAVDVVASGLNNLASVLRQSGRLPEATGLLEEAVEIRRQTVGSTHPSLALVLGQLGQVYNERAEFARAEPLLREALSIRERVYGADHPDTVNARNNLASLLHDQGNLGGAEPLYRAAISSFAAGLGKDHPNYAIHINNLASLLEDLRRFEEAERLYREALDIRRRHYDANHAAVARGEHNLGRVLLAQGRVAEAERLVRGALASRTETLAAGHFEVSLNRGLLGEVLAARGRRAEAETLLVGAVDELSTSLGRDHTGVADALVTLAAFYRRTGRPALAEPRARAAVDIRTARLARGHWKRAAAEVELAMSLAMLKRPNEAAVLARPAADVLVQRLGETDLRAVQARALVTSLGS